MRIHIHTIRKEDVGKRRIKRTPCPHCGTMLPPIDLYGAIGPVMTQDVGKWVYDVDGITQVENDEQFKQRLEQEETPAAVLEMLDSKARDRGMRVVHVDSKNMGQTSKGKHIGRACPHSADGDLRGAQNIIKQHPEGVEYDG